MVGATIFSLLLDFTSIPHTRGGYSHSLIRTSKVASMFCVASEIWCRSVEGSTMRCRLYLLFWVAFAVSGAERVNNAALDGAAMLMKWRMREER